MPCQPLRAATTCCLAAIAACGITEVTSEELTPVVQRDAIPFIGPSAPPEVLDRLAANRLVILGETHFLQEHRAFVAALVRELHGRGFRQLLLELPHMVDCSSVTTPGTASSCRAGRLQPRCWAA